MVKYVWCCLVESHSLQQELSTHTHLPLSSSDLWMVANGWKMLIPPNSPLQCSAYPVLPLAPWKAIWEPAVSESQSMLWYLSVNFMSLVLRTISSAQWWMQKSCGAAGLSGSISAVAVYNWVHFHADHFSLGTISLGHNHSSESKCSKPG